MTRRAPFRTVPVVSALLATLLLVSCSGAPGTAGDRPSQAPGNESSSAPATPEPSSPEPSSPESSASVEQAARLEVNVEDKASDVSVDTAIKVTVGNGTIDKVKVSHPSTGRGGKFQSLTLPGALNEDKTEWTAAEGLDPGAAYTMELSWTGGDGKKVSEKRTFSTAAVAVKNEVFPSVTPLHGGTYGVAMPAIITFDTPIKDKKSIEKHLVVTSTPKQEGTWYWASDTEVRYRPKDYWKPGTKVKVAANINGVKAGKGLYGQTSRTFDFEIRKSAVVDKVDLKNHTVKVYENDKLIKTLPMSAGKEGFVTRSGTKVISEKLDSTRMTSETESVGDPEYYDLDNVLYAMRVTKTGEFFHAAPWNAANMGKKNASHGCVGLTTDNALWLYRKNMIGDPVEFTGSKRKLDQGNGWTDWNVSWDEIKSKSALS
ncbi:L,D-transpeptidase [Propionibacteriaceae bacterium Y1700]|uniref:L,D-transpeptidase n=1 Tax=Microlunatus sp. Y1700 TaxID=3418487 RepID=UPI003DA6E369